MLRLYLTGKMSLIVGKPSDFSWRALRLCVHWMMLQVRAGGTLDLHSGSSQKGSSCRQWWGGQWSEWRWTLASRVCKIGTFQNCNRGAGLTRSNLEYKKTTATFTQHWWIGVEMKYSALLNPLPCDFCQLTVKQREKSNDLCMTCVCIAGAEDAKPVPAPKKPKKKWSPGCWNVYKITCVVNGRVYVGVTNDYGRRIKQHERSPNARMKKDVVAFTPFSLNFDVEILQSCFSKWHAQKEERHHIAVCSALGPRGYNSLKGEPFCDRKVWPIVKYRKKRNAWVAVELVCRLLAFLDFAKLLLLKISLCSVSDYQSTHKCQFHIIVELSVQNWGSLWRTAHEMSLIKWTIPLLVTIFAQSQTLKLIIKALQVTSKIRKAQSNIWALLREVSCKTAMQSNSVHLALARSAFC